MESLTYIHKIMLMAANSVYCASAGWSVCYPPTSHIYEDLKQCSAQLKRNTLFILDDAEYKLGNIGQWMALFNNGRIRMESAHGFEVIRVFIALEQVFYALFEFFGYVADVRVRHGSQLLSGKIKNACP